MNFYAWEKAFSGENVLPGNGQSLPSILTRVLAARGMTDPAAAERFLRGTEVLSDPFLLPDMENAVMVIRRAVAEEKHILVFGDYDCDGITATAMLYNYLENEGADVCYYIPERLSEGYGLCMDTMQMIHNSGIDLIITVDNGISSYDEITYAKEQGIEVVITDHHALPEHLPPANAVVNPRRCGADAPFYDLCGAGVAFKLIAAMEQAGQSEDIQDLLLAQYGDLLALATLADVVPLKGENRLLVRQGIKVLANTERPGLLALAECAKTDLSLCTSETISFILAPRVNAVGRVGSVDTAIQLLLCDDEEQAMHLALETTKLNTTRREIEDCINQEMGELIRRNPALLHRRILSLVGSDWHVGVIGILASRMLNLYRKPCVVISCSNGVARGSARSVEGFSIIEAITACSKYLTKFGGHPLAAGFTLDEASLPAFLEALEQYAAEHFPIMPAQKLHLDAVITPEEISLENVEDLMRLAPFGCENPSPVFLLQGVTIESINALKNGQHLRLNVSDGDYHIPVVYFGMSPSQLPFISGERVDIACALSINVFNGQKSVSVRAINIHPFGWEEEAVCRDRGNFDALMRAEQGGEGFPSFTRDDLALIFRYLREHSPYLAGPDGLYHELRRNRVSISYFRLLAAQQILWELGLIIREENGAIRVLDNPQKMDLNDSDTFCKLQK